MVLQCIHFADEMDDKKSAQQHSEHVVFEVTSATCRSSDMKHKAAGVPVRALRLASKDVS